MLEEIVGFLEFLGVVALCLSPLLLSALAGIRFVKEGTAIAVRRLGGFRKIIMVWKDHKLDDKWNVEYKLGYQPVFGGLCWIGFWPIDRVYEYKFRWRDIQLVGGKEQVQFHEENIDYIFVRPDVYWTDIKAAETKKPERIPLDVQFLVTMRVCNPYLALFAAPSNWNENAMSRLNAKFRGWVGEKTLDEVLSLKEEPKEIWKELKDDPLIKMLEKEWGIKIEENGIEIRDVGLPADYQESAAAEKKMELQAKGFASETSGAEFEMLSRQTGKSVDVLQKEYDNDSDKFLKKYGAMIESNRDFVRRKVTNVLDIRSGDPSGRAGGGELSGS